MSNEVETPAQPRTSRFKEHTNTTNSIHPPPDELWKDLDIEDMLDAFNEEANAPPTRKGAAPKASTPPVFGAPSAAGPASGTVAPAPTEGTLGRFSRVWASMFGGVLGKRKAGHVDAEREREKAVLDERKVAAEQAYEARKLAQEMGLMPTPKVFVRPTATPRSHKCVVEHVVPATTPRTPSLYRSPSKKDLQKQKKLSKRVSDLEYKLASARKELHTVLHKDVPPVPPLPALGPSSSTSDTSQSTRMSSDAARVSSENTQTSSEHTQTSTENPQIFTDEESLHDTPTSTPAPSQNNHVGKIVKKRKAITTIDDATYTPITTDSDGDISMSASEPERTFKRAKSTSSSKKAKRKPSRLTKRVSRGDLRKEEIVTVVPDGKKVPMVPAIPVGVEGQKAKVKGRDDGYGGLGHEMF